MTLAFWLWVSKLIEDLFAQSQTLGTVGMILALLAGGSLAIIVGREAFGLIRLARIEQLHARAARVLETDNRAEARAIIRELLKFEHPNPQLARGRATLDQASRRHHRRRRSDPAGRARTDDAARHRSARADLEGGAARLDGHRDQPEGADRRAVRAIAATRLIGQLARLYGGRPGALGMFKLMRQTVSHLAITGGIALGDSVVQSVLGHGLASRLSSKLGEGVLNGMLTARLGLAADRPDPAAAVQRPAPPAARRSGQGPDEEAREGRVAGTAGSGALREPEPRRAGIMRRCGAVASFPRQPVDAEPAKDLDRTRRRRTGRGGRFVAASACAGPDVRTLFDPAETP